jgi:hypothetical protein
MWKCTHKINCLNIVSMYIQMLLQDYLLALCRNNQLYSSDISYPPHARNHLMFQYLYSVSSNALYECTLQAMHKNIKEKLKYAPMLYEPKL